LTTDFNLCDLDYDLIIINPDGTQDFQAATGDCPETAGISTSAPDGEYQILVDYFSGLNDVSAPVIVPIKLSVSVLGGDMASTVYDDGLFEVSKPDSNSEGGTSTLVATITKTGSTFTVTNEVTGEVIF